MTDLEAYVAQPGRDDLVKQVREKINELGISYIYYQFISVTGRIVGKGIPADHWERTAERGADAAPRARPQRGARHGRAVHIRDGARPCFLQR